MPSSPTSRRVWRIVRLLAILAFVVGAWFFVDMLESRRLRFDGSIGTLRSPGGVWWLDLRKTDPWTYGPHGIHVVIVPTEPGLFGIDRMPFDALAFDLRNDGASLGPDNLIARWEGDSVLHVFAHGQEQADTTYRVDLSGERAWWRHDQLHDLPGNLALGLALWALLEWALAIASTTRPPPESADATGTGNTSP